MKHIVLNLAYILLALVLRSNIAHLLLKFKAIKLITLRVHTL
jgi:hypothetical protein